MRRILWIVLSGLAIASTGCLPGDTRPEPGRVFVTAEASPASVEGFTTEDGWNIHFDKILTGLGNISLQGESCTSYADTTYDRLFNFTAPGEQKVGEVYGLGTCDLSFQWLGPSGDAKLQDGVSRSDIELIWTYRPLIVLMYVRGTAERGTDKKKFAWVFSDHKVLGDCRPDPLMAPLTAITLNGGDDFRHRIEFRAENLFRGFDSEVGALQFDAYAAADDNGDKDITPDELIRHTVGTGMVQQPLYFILVDWNLPNLVTLDGAPCKDLKWMQMD